MDVHRYNISEGLNIFQNKKRQSKGSDKDWEIYLPRVINEKKRLEDSEEGK